MKKSSGPRAYTKRPERWLFLVADAADLDEWVEQAREIALGRHDVSVAYLQGAVPERFPRTAKTHQSHDAEPWYLKQPIERLSRAAARAARRDETWLESRRIDRRLRHQLDKADHIVLVDDAFEWALKTMPPLKARVWRDGSAHAALDEESAWRWLVVQAELFANRGSHDRLPVTGLVARSKHLLGLDEFHFTPEADVRTPLRVLARRLVRRGSRDEALLLLDVMDLFDRWYPPLPDEKAAARALRLHIAIAAGEPRPPDYEDVVREVLAVADRRFASHDAEGGYSFAVIGMALLFHQQLHTATESSPLVEEPDRFLAPLQAADFWKRLLAEEGRRTAERSKGVDARPGPVATPPERQRVLALPGIYHHHAGPMLKALEARGDVDLRMVRLDKPEFAGMILDTTTLRMRFEAQAGDPSFADSLDPEAAGFVRGTDVVVADWADKGAVWASVLAPAEARLVIRIHSVDVLSGPAQLVDWSAVDTVIAVSPHIRDVFKTVLGRRVDHVDVRVVTNRIMTERFEADKSESADWTIGLVGWGQHVKDPVLALDILSALRQSDDRWRLKLIGADFGHNQAEHINRYSREFMGRALQPDVVDAIDYAGFTRKLPVHLRDVGYILSTSLRESCPVGVLEGVASGAVPVVREWPVFARLNAAHQLFPERFVFTTAAEAAKIIEANRAERMGRAAEAKEEMADLFSVEQTEGRLVEAILGRP